MDQVVLLHGLGRTRRSMRRLARALQRGGYEAINLGYPSLRARTPDLGPLVAARIEKALEAAPRGQAGRVHFVGHSLGGILIRWLLVHRRPQRLGRIVLLAPPNRGSHMADFTAPWLTWLMRPLPDLRTDPSSFTHSLALPAGVEIGIIAGSWDKTVTPPQTRLAGATGHIVVRSGHTFIADLKDVHALTLRFLATGRFGG